MNIINLQPGITSGEVAHILANAPENTEIRLSPQSYPFSNQDVFRGVFAPSNNDTGEKKVVFPILQKRKLRIDGRGATLSFQERLFPFILQACEDVVLENFVIDFTFPRYAVADVEESDENGFTLLIDGTRFPFRVEDKSISFRSGSEWRSTARKKYFVAPIGGKGPVVYLVAGETEDPLTNLPVGVLRTDAERLSENRVRFTYRPDSPRMIYKVGQRLLISHDENRENDLFFLERCKNTTLKNIRILRGAGMGCIGQLCHNITFDGIHIETDPDRNEPCSITADAFHFLHCSGDLIIRNCTVRDTLDDAANIHGIYTKVESVHGNGAVVRLGHHEQFGFNPYFPGDGLNILNEAGEIGQIRVQKSELTEDGTAIALTFSQCAEEILHPGDYLDNPDRMPDILLENNDFENCPRILLASPRKTVVRGNRLKLHGAVTVTGGVDYWYESGMSKEVLIENNTFLGDPGRESSAVCVSVKGGNICNLRHHSITVTGNRLEKFTELLSGEDTEYIFVEGNTSDAGKCEVRLLNCRNVVIR